MKYYALFLDTNGYIEKCLTLIRFICNPNSKSLPHITMRVFRENGLGIERIEKVEATHLNLFEVGSFNIESQTPPYIVFIRCESEDLEAQEYKPDFPQSFLHITLYKGNDLEFAKKVHRTLSDMQWNIKLVFNPPKGLVQQNIGETILDEFFYLNVENIFKEILGRTVDVFSINNDQKIVLIKEVISKLKLYKCNNDVKTVEPLYRNTFVAEDVSNIIFHQNTGKQETINNEKIITNPVNKSIFITPPEYAQEMAECATAFLGENDLINFGDSSIGTGSLYLALLNRINNNGTNRRIASAMGIDIDFNMVKEASNRYSSRNLEVKHKDALFLDEQILNNKRNLMLVNPPYNRSHDIPKVYRDKIFNIAKNHTGISISKEASLYVYHLLIIDKWLAQEGIAAWLLPSTFLQANYGQAVREYLTNNVTLLKIHIYDDTKEQFDKTNVSTTLIVFKKTKATSNSSVEVSYGESAIDSVPFKISLEAFQKEQKNWRQIVFNSENFEDRNYDCVISDLFDVKRGLATGANSFFVLDRERAKELEIPDIALKPLLPKARFIKSTIIERAKDGFPLLDMQLVLVDCDLPELYIKEKFPAFYEYLQTARLPQINGKSVIQRTLVKTRNPWYKQEFRLPPPYLLTYMGRDKKDLPPLYFLLNKSDAVALNTYLLLYPKKWLSELLESNVGLDEKLLECLNYSAYKNISKKTRVYSGALKKLEPNELRNLSVSNLPKLILNKIRTN